MPKARLLKGLLDTSVVVELEVIDPLVLPVDVAISAITMAELAAGPHAAKTADERARRQDRLQRAEAVFGPLPFDLEVARAYGRVSPQQLSLGARPAGPARSTCSLRRPRAHTTFRY